jgi:phosphate transport system substrate-binding protein
MQLNVAIRLVVLGLLATSVLPCEPRASELSVVGTGDGMEILRALGVAFGKTEAAVEITVPPSIGSGGGIAAVGAGSAILGRVARNLTDAEVSRGLVYTPFARLPSAFFVHPGTRVSNLSTRELAAIYAGKISNWKEVGGADLRVRVVRREEADSTLGVLRASMPGWQELAITERSKTATSTQEAIETVRLVEGAIGFGPFTRTLEHGTTVLTIDGHHPTEPRYPSSAVLAFIHTDATVTPDAKAFMTFAASSQAKAIIKEFGGVPVAH